MKRHFLLFLFVTGLLNISAQTLVSTDVQLKNAVLEEFTGIHCVYCPEGHAIAASILENNPGRSVAIAIHQGSFAVPSGSEPDYRTPWGNSIATQAGVNSYPSATVNRHLFTGNVTNISRGDWVSRSTEIMAQESPVNVGVESSYNESTRELTIHVELYYTSDASEASNFINVALLQDHIFGPQTGGGAGNNYEHMHMLRDMITGQWGEEIMTTTTGSFVDKTYIYTVPETITNIPCIVEDCQIAVFVTETHQEVLSGDVVDAIGGTNQFIGNVTINETNEIQAGSNGASTTYTVQANSNIEGNEEFEITLTSEDAPADWVTSFTVNGIVYENQAIVTLPYHIDTPIDVIVTPGSSAALANFKLEMKSVSIPQAPAKYVHIYTISGVENLVVNATGGPEPITYQHIYVDGLAAAGSTTVGLTDAEIIVKGMNAGAFDAVRNMYLNIAWTFPALTLTQMEAVKAFMDNGGNILIAGQDIGWDFMSGDAAGHGSPEATDFYQNYLHANYVSDGNTANNLFIAETTDEVYGAVVQSSVVDVYGGNMYPEQISAREGALQSFYYNATKTKCAAVRAETENYKVVYFGVGLEMIQNVDVCNQIINATLNWFDIGVGVTETPGLNSFVKVFPNPNSTGKLQFEGNINLNSVEIIDLSGKSIANQTITNSESIDISNLHSGMYLVKMITNEGVFTSKLSVK